MRWFGAGILRWRGSGRSRVVCWRLGETLRKAVVREALEETGLTIEPGELLGVFERVLPDEQGKFRYHYVLIDFSVSPPFRGSSQAGDDADEVGWFRQRNSQSWSSPAKRKRLF